MRCLLLLAAGLAVAAPKPDFTGEWRLNTAKSNFARETAPSMKVVQIDHRDPTLVMTTVETSARGPLDGTVFYSTDGVARTVEVLGNQLQATTRWNGDALEVRTTGKFG